MCSLCASNVRAWGGRLSSDDGSNRPTSARSEKNNVASREALGVKSLASDVVRVKSVTGRAPPRGGGGGRLRPAVPARSQSNGGPDGVMPLVKDCRPLSRLRGDVRRQAP